MASSTTQLNSLKAQGIDQAYRFTAAWKNYLRIKENNHSMRKTKSTLEVVSNSMAELLSTLESIKPLAVVSPFLEAFVQQTVKIINNELEFWDAEIATLDTAQVHTPPALILSRYLGNSVNSNLPQAYTFHGKTITGQ